MMATGDNAMQLLVQKLKLRFPEIPEEVVKACAQQYPCDYNRCIQMLSQKSPDYLYGPISGLNMKPEQEFGSNSSQSNHQIHQQQSVRYANYQYQARNDTSSYTRQNGNSSPVNPRFYNQNANFIRPPSDSRPMSSVRSASVSGPSPPISSTSGYQSGPSAAFRHPKSAPVVSDKYQPFQSFDSNTQSQSYTPPSSASQMPMSMPPAAAHPETFYAQQGIFFDHCNYEMRVSYKAQVTKQRDQMERFHQKLMGDKAKLDSLKMDVAAMERELSKRIKPTHNILPHEEIQKLKQETDRLRIECSTMSDEVDNLFKGKVPLGETSEDFYKHINRGPSGSVGLPPVQTAPVLPFPSQPSNSSDEEGHQWSCSTCTFLNNPALDKCEMCEMPRIMLGMPHSHSSLTIQSGPCYCHRQTVP